MIKKYYKDNGKYISIRRYWISEWAKAKWSISENTLKIRERINNNNTCHFSNYIYLFNEKWQMIIRNEGKMPDYKR